MRKLAVFILALTLAFGLGFGRAQTSVYGGNAQSSTQGTSVNWRSAWSVSTSYAINDAVSFGGSSYIAILAGTGHEPDSSPTYWGLLAQAGSMGAAGSAGGGTVTGVAATAPVVSSGGTAPVISMPAATTSVDGYLAHADWNTFNGKQAAGTYLTAVTATGPVASSGGTTPVISISAIPLTDMATQAADTFLGNASAITDVPTAVAMPSGCTTGVNYSTSTHTWTCPTPAGGGVTSGTAPIVVIGPNASCPNCALVNGSPNLSLVGGIVGGWLGASVSNSQMSPFDYGYGQTNVVTTFPMVYRNFSVVTTTSQTNGNMMDFSWKTYTPSGNVFGPSASITSSVAPGAAAGVYSQGPGSSLFYAAPYLASVIQIDGTASPATVAGFSWDVIGTTAQPMGIYTFNNTVGGSSTVYQGPGGDRTLNANVHEYLNGVIIPYASTLNNMCVWTGGTQNVGGSLVVTLRNTDAGTSYSTPVVVTVPAGGVAGLYCDNTDSASIAPGDWVDWQFTNNYSGASAGVYSVGMELTPSSGPETGMITFYNSLGGAGMPSGTAHYVPPFVFPQTGYVSTELAARAPMPRAVTMKNLACLWTTSPGTSPVTIYVMHNGSKSALTVTIPTTGTGNQIVTDSMHTESFAMGDTFDLYLYQASGSNPYISSCSVEVD